MRQCPECKRVYYDERLNFCLDDGAELLHGPASEDPATAFMQPAAPARSERSSGESSSFGIPPSGGRRADEKTQLFPNAPSEDGTSDERQTPRAINLRLPLTIFAIASIAVAGYLGYRYLAAADADQIHSIAVVPFVNESGNADIEYLSDGISETLINSLTQLPNLNVKPRSSAFRYKGRESEAKAIGSELGVGAIITGRLTQRGDDITLFIRLVDTASENQIWGHQYQRKLANLVTLQTEIARDISANLRTRLTRVGEERAQNSYSTDPDAYRLYLQGRYHWNKRSRRDMELAIDYFKQSTARDPRFAPAFAGLADSLIIVGSYTGTAASQFITEARTAATTALSINPESADARISLGTVYLFYDHDFGAAEREFRHAVALDARSGHARQMLGLLLTVTGRQDDALEEYRQALQLEPVSLPINRGYALALAYARRYDESVIQFEKTIELDRGFVLSYYGLAGVLGLQKKYSESVEMHAAGLEVAGAASDAARLRAAYLSGGWHGYVRESLSGQMGPTPTPNFLRAADFADLGDKESAISELRKSLEKRESFITLINVHPSLDPIRDDPRFKALIAEVGLPVDR